MDGKDNISSKAAQGIKIRIGGGLMGAYKYKSGSDSYRELRIKEAHKKIMRGNLLQVSI